MGSAITVESDRRIRVHRRLSETYTPKAANEEPLWIEPGPVAGSYLLGGRLDYASADHLAKLVPPPGAIDVMLDMSAISFVDSSGIEAIIELASRIDRVVVVTRPSGPARAALAAAELEELRGIVVREEEPPADDRTIGPPESVDR